VSASTKGKNREVHEDGVLGGDRANDTYARNKNSDFTENNHRLAKARI